MVRSRVAAVSVRSVYQPAGAPPPSAAPRATYPPAGSSSAAAPATPSIFSNIESMIRTTLSGAGGSPGSGWEEIEGSWVVRPAAGVPLEAVIHFTGGAFVGAVPQWAYRPFLEALAARGMVVIATPYATTFDHLRIADEAQFKYDCALRRLGPAVSGLPAFGIGHSLGSVVQMLISSRYAVQRNGEEEERVGLG